jgi:hypothetical protein
MNVASAVGIALIVIWAIITFAFDAPGWVHLLLTLGVFVLIWGIVMRGTREQPGRRTNATGAARSPSRPRAKR